MCLLGGEYQSQTYPGTADLQPFPNGCLAVNSSRSYLAGGMILAM